MSINKQTEDLGSIPHLEQVFFHLKLYTTLDRCFTHRGGEPVILFVYIYIQAILCVCALSVELYRYRYKKTLLATRHKNNCGIVMKGFMPPVKITGILMKFYSLHV